MNQDWSNGFLAGILIMNFIWVVSELIARAIKDSKK